MDENQNNTNDANIVKCLYCGTLNDKKNHYCTNCGTIITQDTSVQEISTPEEQNNEMKQTIQDENENKEQIQNQKSNKIKPLTVVLAVLAAFLAFLNQYLAIIVIITALIALFNRKTKSYGKTVFKVIGIFAAIIVVIIVALFGMCIIGFSQYT